MEGIASPSRRGVDDRSRKDRAIRRLKGKSVTFSSALGATESARETLSGDGVFLRGETDATSLEMLLDEVHAVGERLKRTPTMTTISEYKDAIRSFVKYVVTHVLNVEDSEGIKSLNPLRKQKKYTLIRVIDRKLEQLAAEIFRSQRDQVEILEAVDEIHGLLVDLLY